MKLIVDSGSTKTDWCFASSQDNPVVLQTAGINPVVQSPKETREIIERQLMPKCHDAGIDVDDVCSVVFYGAGCLPGNTDGLTAILAENFATAKNMNVYSDLLAACHALCGTHEGIVCILGTGANSCYYDGCNIARHTPALGYILGDEGSGAVLGKKLLNAVYKGTLPEDICGMFYEETGLDMGKAIEKVYRGVSPNRFLASMSEFVARHINRTELRDVVAENFDDFITRNIMPYTREEPQDEKKHDAIHTINAVGSIAYHYRDILETVAEKHGFKVGRILKSPIERLLEYHFKDLL